MKSDDNSRDMDSGPMFSVIIATYNRAGLLERALKSLSGQSEKDWEGIIADDESTDDTYARILPFLKADNRIKYFRKKHSGEAHTKNYGIRMSSGRYITFLDSDDEYHRDHLASRKRILMQNPGISFLYGGVEILGNQYVPDRNDPSRPIHLKDCIIGGTFVISRETLMSLEGFRNIKLGPDSDLFERALKKEIPMMKLDLPTYIYHHENPDSITNIMFGKIKDQ